MTSDEYIDKAWVEFDKGNLAKAELLLKFADIAVMREKIQAYRERTQSEAFQSTQPKAIYIGNAIGHTRFRVGPN